MHHWLGTNNMKYTQRETDRLIGENIAKVRKNLNITQEDMSRTLGVSRRALCSYECGKCSVPVFLLPKISDVLKVSVSALMDIKVPFTDERTREAHILKRMEKIKKLPPEEQKAVFTLIDSLTGRKMVKTG